MANGVMVNRHVCANKMHCILHLCTARVNTFYSNKELWLAEGIICSAQMVRFYTR